MSVQGKQYSIVKLTSNFNGWQYLTVMPTAQFMKRVRASYLVFNLTVIGVLLLGIVMSFFFANNSYRPLRRLVDALKGQANDGGNRQYGDEIDFISDTILRVTKENKSLMSRLKSKGGMMKEQLLLRLLYGKIQAGEELDEMLEISGMKLMESCFTVVLLLIDDYEGFSKSNTQAMQDVLRFSMIGATEELCAEFGDGYGMDLVDSHGLVFLLNFSYDNPEKLSHFILRVKDFIREYYGITLTAGIGNTYSQASMIGASFNEARTAAYFRLIKGQDQIIFYREIEERSESKYCYPAEQELHLVMAVKEGNAAQAATVIGHLIENLRCQHPTPETARYVWLGIVITLAKVFDEMGINAIECVGDKIEDLMTVKSETVETLEKRLIDLYVRACEYVERHKKSRKAALKDKIMIFISDNCNDSNLCVDHLADAFTLSPSYITRFFKEQTGYSVKHYIDILRMEKIKSLLRTTNLTLKEIVIQVGYVDETNVIRKFKKSEGITPIQYRAIAK